MTLDAIVRRNAQRFPDKPGIVCGTQMETWAELDATVSRLANALLGSGLMRGDRVAILMGNCPEYLQFYFACARAGLISVPLNYRLTAAEAAQIVGHAEPRLFVTDAAHAGPGDAICARLPGRIQRWHVGGGAPPEALDHGLALAAAGAEAISVAGDERDPVAIFYTSGTTGLPKGAMVSHLNLVMNGLNQLIADRASCDDVNLIATPIYHVGAVFMAVTYMMRGCTQIVLPQFSPGSWLDTLAASRATVSLLVPTMINAVLNEPTLESHDRSSLRLIFYGGGPMPPAVLERAIRRFRCGFTQGYGLTETLEATFLVAGDHVLDGTAEQRRRLASAGREAVDADIRIVDDTGHDLPPETIGEILVRSRSVISGYWRQPEATRESIRDGWFYTGDLGFLDRDRYLFVVDRKKDMIVTGAINVYTKEIEAVLHLHAAVREAAVFGLPDEKWGEIVTAAVVRHPGATVTDAELIEHCRLHLAGFKLPKRVAFLDDLPKTPSGKVLKRELRTLVRPA